MRTELERALASGGFSCSRETLNKLLMYYELLSDWNQHTNLTALTEPRDFIYKHILDSLYAAQSLPPGTSLVDVGSGAGFPGLPLKLVYPTLSVTLMEAALKKVKFLEHCCTALAVDAVVIHARAEEMGQGALRETYTCAVTRAVAALSVVSEYCLPLLQVGGHMLALKGPGGDAEVSAAGAAIRALGGAVQNIRHYRLPTGDQRSLILVKKVAATPDKYPRRPGMPAKKPL